VVFKQDGGRIVKQEVATGAMNDDDVIIERGLAEGERVLLSVPHERDRYALVRLPGSGTTPPTAGGDTAAPARTPVPVRPDSASASGPKLARPKKS
jgi:hypothetical protein